MDLEEQLNEIIELINQNIEKVNNVEYGSDYYYINHTFKEFRPIDESSKIGERQIGVLVATDTGPATPYAIEHVEERGVMFILPTTQIYEGMIVGENKYDTDLAVN